MMRNIRLTIEYDGTRFSGWQKQGSRVLDYQGIRVPRRERDKKRFRTVQGEIEKAGQKLFGEAIRLIGSGRTDAGVHAERQVANFKVNSNLPLTNIKKGLNSYLPDDVVILLAQDSALEFHSRFDAKEKVYRYSILNRKERSPLLSRYTGFVPYDLDIAKMKKASKYFIGKMDFKSFQASDKKKRKSVRTVKKLDIVDRPPLIEIYIQADGFLYNMVRNIVGTLIEVARGRIQPDAIKGILARRYRPVAGYTAPAKGLSLVKVIY